LALPLTKNQEIIMLKRAVLASVVGLCAVFSSSHGAETGQQIMELQKTRHQVKSEIEVDVMMLVDQRNNKQQRELKRSFKQVGGDLHKAALVFTAPASIRGTSLLIWEQNEREDDQWLFLPAQKKLQRIASGSRKSYFMGTDFTYEDMAPEDIGNFVYKILRMERLDNQDCVVIEATPKTQDLARKSAYRKRILWVRQDIYFTVKVEFYGRKDRLIKTQTNYELTQVADTAWRAKKAMMDNHAKKHKTLLMVKSRQVNMPIEDSVFAERNFLSGKHLD
jgi:hypothetical protein